MLSTRERAFGSLRLADTHLIQSQQNPEHDRTQKIRPRNEVVVDPWRRCHEHHGVGCGGARDYKEGSVDV